MRMRYSIQNSAQGNVHQRGGRRGGANSWIPLAKYMSNAWMGRRGGGGKGHAQSKSESGVVLLDGHQTKLNAGAEGKTAVLCERRGGAQGREGAAAACAAPQQA